MHRTPIAGVAAITLALAGASRTLADHTCKPTMAFTGAHYSSMQLPKRERTWTVAFTVDASRCATETGSFSILFTVWKENAPDVEFVETFMWKPDLNVISKDFWVDEAVGAYRVSEIPSCPCRK